MAIKCNMSATTKEWCIGFRIYLEELTATTAMNFKGVKICLNKMQS